jgi:hypothetical protein
MGDSWPPCIPAHPLGADLRPNGAINYTQMNNQSGGVKLCSVVISVAGQQYADL